jgi:hypothetical protein
MRKVGVALPGKQAFPVLLAGGLLGPLLACPRGASAESSPAIARPRQQGGLAEELTEFPEFSKKFTAAADSRSDGANGTGFMQRAMVPLSPRYRSGGWGTLTWLACLLFVLLGAQRVSGHEVVRGTPAASLLGFQRSVVLRRSHRSGPSAEEKEGTAEDEPSRGHRPEAAQEAGMPASGASLLGLQRGRHLSKARLPDEPDSDAAADGQTSGDGIWLQRGARLRKVVLADTEDSDDDDVGVSTEGVGAKTAARRGGGPSASVFGLQRRTVSQKVAATSLDERDD